MARRSFKRLLAAFLAGQAPICGVCAETIARVEALPVSPVVQGVALAARPEDAELPRLENLALPASENDDVTPPQAVPLENQARGFASVYDHAAAAGKDEEIWSIMDRALAVEFNLAHDPASLSRWKTEVAETLRNDPAAPIPRVAAEAYVRARVLPRERVGAVEKTLLKDNLIVPRFEARAPEQLRWAKEVDGSLYVHDSGGNLFVKAANGWKIAARGLGYIDNLVKSGGALYALSTEGIFRREGEAWRRPWRSSFSGATFDQLAEQDGKFYGFVRNTGEVYVKGWFGWKRVFPDAGRVLRMTKIGGKIYLLAGPGLYEIDRGVLRRAFKDSVEVHRWFEIDGRHFIYTNRGFAEIGWSSDSRRLWCRILVDNWDEEPDIEKIAASGKTVYALGRLQEDENERRRLLEQDVVVGPLPYAGKWVLVLKPWSGKWERLLKAPDVDDIAVLDGKLYVLASQEGVDRRWKFSLEVWDGQGWNRIVSASNPIDPPFRLHGKNYFTAFHRLSEFGGMDWQNRVLSDVSSAIERRDRSSVEDDVIRDENGNPVF